MTCTWRGDERSASGLRSTAVGWPVPHQSTAARAGTRGFGALSTRQESTLTSSLGLGAAAAAKSAARTDAIASRSPRRTRDRLAQASRDRSVVGEPTAEPPALASGRCTTDGRSWLLRQVDPPARGVRPKSAGEQAARHRGSGEPRRRGFQVPATSRPTPARKHIDRGSHLIERCALRTHYPAFEGRRLLPWELAKIRSLATSIPIVAFTQIAGSLGR